MVQATMAAGASNTLRSTRIGIPLDCGCGTSAWICLRGRPGGSSEEANCGAEGRPSTDAPPHRAVHMVSCGVKAGCAAVICHCPRAQANRAWPSDARFVKSRIDEHARDTVPDTICTCPLGLAPSSGRHSMTQTQHQSRLWTGSPKGATLRTAEQVPGKSPSKLYSQRPILHVCEVAAPGVAVTSCAKVFREYERFPPRNPPCSLQRPSCMPLDT